MYNTAHLAEEKIIVIICLLFQSTPPPQGNDIAAQFVAPVAATLTQHGGEQPYQQPMGTMPHPEMACLPPQHPYMQQQQMAADEGLPGPHIPPAAAADPHPAPPIELTQQHMAPAPVAPEPQPPQVQPEPVLPVAPLTPEVRATSEPPMPVCSVLIIAPTPQAPNREPAVEPAAAVTHVEPVAAAPAPEPVPEPTPAPAPAEPAPKEPTPEPVKAAPERPASVEKPAKPALTPALRAKKEQEGKWKGGGLVCMHYINGLVQDCSNSLANALELLQSCTKPLTYQIQ